MEHKIGSVVTVKQRYLFEEEHPFAPNGMKEFCGEQVTIYEVHLDFYIIIEDENKYKWFEDMFEN